MRNIADKEIKKFLNFQKKVLDKLKKIVYDIYTGLVLILIQDTLHKKSQQFRLLDF